MRIVGIMQGRLSPAPLGRMQAFPGDWRGEFDRAARIGFDTIEWLVTAASLEANPLLDPNGRREIRDRMSASGVAVRTICGDCFLHRPFVGVADEDRDRNVALLCRMIADAAAIGATTLIIPVIEQAALRSVDDAAGLARTLAPACAEARASGITIAIESDAASFAAIVDAGSPDLAACYDIGNAASAGTQVDDDLRLIGSRLAVVHIKDRHRDGASTALGSGDADFTALFDALSANDFKGPLILETPVGADPGASAAQHLAFVRRHLAATVGARR